MILTPRGAALLGAAVALLVAGLLKIDGALVALGAAGLLLILLVLIMGRWNLTRLRLKLQAPSRVFADTPFDLRVTQINHRNLFDAYGIDLEVELSNIAKVRSHASWTAARSSATAKLRGSIPRRGAIPEHPAHLRSKFPLSLFEHRRQIVLNQEILVFPKALVPREFFASGEFDDAWNGEGLQPGDSPGEPRGLRPFRPGDQAKRLHWPATIRSLARGRDPRVREYDPPGLRPRRATIIFHSFGTDHSLIRTDLFERALSLTCGTLRHLRRIGVPTTLRADFLLWEKVQTFQSEAWSETLAILARARRAEGTEAHDLIAEIEAVPKDEALVIISDMSPDAWCHILPDRKALIIDIHQHAYKKRGMKFTPKNVIPAPAAKLEN